MENPEEEKSQFPNVKQRENQASALIQYSSQKVAAKPSQK
jgi:hypothetical protein